MRAKGEDATASSPGDAPAAELSAYAFSILREGPLTLTRGRCKGLTPIITATGTATPYAIFAGPLALTINVVGVYKGYTGSELEKLLAEAQALADQIAAGPATSLGLTKTLLNRAYSTSFDQFLEEEAMAQAIAFGSPEFAEGTAAFLAKRRPDFSKA